MSGQLQLHFLSQPNFWVQCDFSAQLDSCNQRKSSVSTAAKTDLASAAASADLQLTTSQHFSKAQVIQLSDQDLEVSLKNLVQEERNLLHEILLHIREVDRRKLYLDRARSSLFDYLVTDLGFSSSAAMRRIEASRFLIQVPELAASIQEGKINLTQVGELSRALKEKERETGEKVDLRLKKHVLLKMENKSTKQTQKILAQELDLQLRPVEEKRIQKNDSVFIQMTLTAKQYEKLMQAKDQLAHVHVQQGKDFSLNQIIETLCDRVLNEKSATRKVTKLRNVAVATQEDAPPGNPNAPDQAKAKKYSLATTSDSCVSEIQTYCQYRDPLTGNVCKNTFALERDHIHPLWAGGADTPENIQILCSAHNKHRYLKQAGIRAVPDSTLYGSTREARPGFTAVSGTKSY